MQPVTNDASSLQRNAATDAIDSGLSLHVYDDHEGKPSDIRQTIKTRRGLLVAGRGSSEWHGRPPLLEGEHIALISACFVSNDHEAHTPADLQSLK